MLVIVCRVSAGSGDVGMTPASGSPSYGRRASTQSWTGCACGVQHGGIVGTSSAVGGSTDCWRKCSSLQNTRCVQIAPATASVAAELARWATRKPHVTWSVTSQVCRAIKEDREHGTMLRVGPKAMGGIAVRSEAHGLG